jgi:hypothetical protein
MPIGMRNVISNSSMPMPASPIHSLRDMPIP